MKRRGKLQDLRRCVEQEQLTSCMNDTKWRRAISALESISGFRPSFRVRCITDSSDPPRQWDHFFPYHIPTHAHIEWLEIDPVVRTHRGHLVADGEQDFTSAVARALCAARIPFSLEAGAIRIWGYIRPGADPVFVTDIDGL